MTDRRAQCLQVAFLTLFAAGFFSPEAHAQRPSNVVLIIGDDQAWTDFGFMGHKDIRTPHLDLLASQSATFTRGYVPMSLCRPSLATLLMGRYPHEHRISGNDPPKGTDRREMLRHVHSQPTLPKWLGQKGYASFQTGKWWEGNFADGGFTAGMTHGDPSRGGRHGDLGLKIGREGLQPIRDFLSANGNKPFFLWYAPMMPHTPHTPPERLLAKYQRPDRTLPIAKYYAMCEWFDETVGELMAILDERVVADNTLVVFVTDNGWIQQPNANGFAPKSKRSPYDGGLRTPILVRWPGRVSPAKFETPVSSIDIVPTILAAVGIAPDQPLPGLNLMDIAKNGGQCDRKSLFGEIFDHDVADIDRPAASLQFRWTLSEGRWKLILPQGGGEPELYDVLADPTETKNQAGDQRETVARLTADIERWWSAK
jgi:uncharacterized sulfatase